MKLYTPSKVQRRLGERLFLKAERDTGPKAAYVRRPYPPGARGKKRGRSPGEFYAELREKQRLRFIYGLSDTQLQNAVRQASRSQGKPKPQALYELLERRLDNVVYRLGFCPSRRIARQLVSHGHFLLNAKPARTPSRLLKPGDEVLVRESSRGTAPFHGLAERLKKIEPPEWLKLYPEEWRGRVTGPPSGDETTVTMDLPKIIEFYSR